MNSVKKTLNKVFKELTLEEGLVFLKNGVPPKIVRSIIQQESEWDVDNISHNRNGTRDMGLMQINSGYMNYYKRKFWTEKEIFDPLKNIMPTLGIRYLAYLIRYYKGNTDLAIQAYNCGPTQLMQEKYLHQQ